MERSVRYIQLPNGGLKPALCFRTKLIAYCVINDETIVRVVEVPWNEYESAPLVKYRGSWYDAGEYVTAIRKVGARKGITQRAVALLDLPPETAELPDLPPDDPVPSAGENPSPRMVPGSKPPLRSERTLRETGSSGRQPKTERAKYPSAPAIRAPRPPERSSGTSRSPEAAEVVYARSGKPVKPTLVRKLAAELRLSEQECRVKLRAAGLRAPYTDEIAMKKALQK